MLSLQLEKCSQILKDFFVGSMDFVRLSCLGVFTSLTSFKFIFRFNFKEPKFFSWVLDIYTR